MSSSHEAASQAPNAGEYILHHLGNLNTSGKPQAEIIDFSIFNIDTFVFALLTGGLGIYLMWRVARNASAGVPGRAQAAMEILVEMVMNQAKTIIHNEESRKFVAPLALTVFVWVFLMNSMDFLPVDLLPAGWERTARNSDCPCGSGRKFKHCHGALI